MRFERGLINRPNVILLYLNLNDIFLARWLILHLIKEIDNLYIEHFIPNFINFGCERVFKLYSSCLLREADSPSQIFLSFINVYVAIIFFLPFFGHVIIVHTYIWDVRGPLPSSLLARPTGVATLLPTVPFALYSHLQLSTTE